MCDSQQGSGFMRPMKLKASSVFLYEGHARANLRERNEERRKQGILTVPKKNIHKQDRIRTCKTF